MQTRQHPAIQLPTLGDGDRVGCRVNAIDVGVTGEEAVDVGHRHEQLAPGFDNAGVRVLGAVPGGRGRHQIPAHGIGAMLVQGLEGVDRVALGLGHLLALGVQQQAVDDHVLVGHRVHHQGGDGVQGVEPAAGLVQAFGDEVRREIAFERVLVLERIVPLGEGHGTRVEPDVDDFRNTAHGAALAIRPGDVVNKRAMQVQSLVARPGVAGLGLEFFDGADHLDLLGVPVGDPDGQWGAPEAMAGQGPVDIVLQPLAKSAAADMFGLPTDLLVQLDQPLLDGGGADKPALHRVAHQRRAAPPVMRIVVQILVPLEEQAAFFQVPANRLVGILEPEATNQRDVVLKMAIATDRVDHVHTETASGLEVIGAEGWRGVHNAGAIFGGHVVSRRHHVGAGMADVVIERRGIAGAGQGLPGHALQHLEVFTQHLGGQGFGDDVPSRFGLCLDVGDAGANGQQQVGDQGPGRGGPGEKRRAGFIDQREGGDDGGVSHFLVAKADLMAG